MRELPSFNKFNESIKVADINEGVFHRLPKDIISDELYLTSKNLQNFYDRTAAGNDVDPGVIDTIIRGLDKVKKAVKRFNSKEEVAGTVYESEINEAMSFDELKNKYIENPYGIGAQAVEYVEGERGNPNRLVFRHDERSRRDEIAKKLKAFGIPAKKMSTSTQDKAYKYRYELTLSESEEVNEASVQVAGNAKPSGAQVLATVIVEHLIARDFFKPGIDKMKKDVIKDIQKVIMDSTF